MGKAGRKAKAGKRERNGRLQRNNYPEPKLEKPSAWVAERVARYGVHYCWALGRAYASGLLDDGDALSRYQAAKKFVRVYQRFYGSDAYACPLDNSPRGSNVVDLTISEYQERDREWLRTAMDSMDVSGGRPYLEQLLSRQHTDQGPPWLDRLLDVVLWNQELPQLNAQLRAKHGSGFVPLGLKEFNPHDRMILDTAIRALDVITPERKPLGILAQTY